MFTSTKFAALSVLLATSVLATDCARKYTVKPGDYCDMISAQQNSSTYQLATVNYGVINSKCDNLMPDQVICLGSKGSDCQTTYVVIPDDTIEAITGKFGMNSTILMENNPQLHADSSNLYIGEVLCVAGGVIVPPAAPGEPPASEPPIYAEPSKPQPTPPGAPVTPKPPKPEPPKAPAHPTPPTPGKPPVDPKPSDPKPPTKPVEPTPANPPTKPEDPEDPEEDDCDEPEDDPKPTDPKPTEPEDPEDPEDDPSLPYCDEL